MALTESSFAQAQQQLATWSERLAVITRNANELSEAEATKRVRNRLREGGYSGQTQEQANMAVQSLRDLMDYYLMLAQVIEQANQEMKGGLFELQSARAAKVMALLNAPSVALPRVNVPLSQRGLLTQEESATKAKPAEVLAAMEALFVRANDIFTTIDSAAADMAHKEQAMRGKTTALAGRMVALALDPAQIPPFETQVDSGNPLESLAALAGYQHLLEGLETQVAALESQHNAVVQALPAARCSCAYCSACRHVHRARHSAGRSAREVWQACSHRSHAPRAYT
jgi:hypothetical protein